MSSIYTLLLVIQIISALSIIGLVLMQHGKGADMGSSFGSGSAGSLFGATGAANFLSRTTKWAAVLFFAVTTALAYFSYAPSRALQEQQSQDTGIMQGYQDRSVPQLGDQPVNNAGGAAAVPSVVPAAPAAPTEAPAPAEPQAAPAEPAVSAPAADAAPAPAEVNAPAQAEPAEQQQPAAPTQEEAAPAPAETAPAVQ